MSTQGVTLKPCCQIDDPEITDEVTCKKTCCRDNKIVTAETHWVDICLFLPEAVSSPLYWAYLSVYYVFMRHKYPVDKIVLVMMNNTWTEQTKRDIIKSKKVHSCSFSLHIF